MKILLDHNLDWRLSTDLHGHEVSTTFEMAWDTLKNGALLTQAETFGFSALLTAGKGIKHQQMIEGRSIAVVIIRAPANKLATHRTIISGVIDILKTIQPGQVIEVFHPDLKS